MAIVNTGLSEVGLRSEFFQRFEQAAAATLWGDVATTIKSEKQSERFGFIGSVPMVREFGSGRLARGMFTEKYEVTPGKYESTLEIDRDEVSDDQTGQIRIRISEMAERVAQHRDVLLASCLNNGHSAGFHAYDGKPFFATDHSSGKSGAQNNTLSINITTPADPTVAEIKTTFAQALPRLMSFKDDQGEPMNNEANGLIAVIPPNMMLAFAEAMNSTIVAQTTNVLQGLARVVPFTRLTADDSWFLIKTNVSVRPFIFLDREPVEFKSLEDGEEAFKREKFLVGCRYRGTMTFGQWTRALKITYT